MTIENITDFVRSCGFKTLIEKQNHGIKFGFNIERVDQIYKECRLEVLELDCNPVLSKGKRIGPGPIVTSSGRFIPLMVGTDDLAFTLFSMKDDAENRLRGLETDDSIRRRTGNNEFFHERMNERNMSKTRFENALLNLDNTINQIGNGNYEFKRMEVCQSNIYE